jgi:hypothetical protein
MGVKVELKKNVGLRSELVHLLLVSERDSKDISARAFAKSAHDETFCVLYDKAAAECINVGHIEHESERVWP